MRRTRFVLLPVKSWQYVGLMVVSLACLTLGLVSRDREGKSGSLVGPELKHIAPHEVDACPNVHPSFHRLLSVDELTPLQQFEKKMIVSSSDESRMHSLSLGNRGRRISRQRSNHNTESVRVTSENRRLTRSLERRDSRDLNHHMRRSIAIERRIADFSQIRESNKKRSDRQIFIERRINDIRQQEGRINQLSRYRSLDSRRISEENMRRVRKEDRRITDKLDNRENMRNSKRQMTRDNNQEKQKKEMQLSRNVDRIEIGKLSSKIQENSIDQRDTRLSAHLIRRVERQIQSNNRRVDLRPDVRRSSIRSEERKSDRRRQDGSIEVCDRLSRTPTEASRLNVRSEDRRSSQRREIRSAERRDFRINVRDEIPWIDSLRRNTLITRSNRAVDDVRYQIKGHVTREQRTSGGERRNSRSEDRENIQQRRFSERSPATEQNRSRRINSKYRNPLITMPQLLNIDMIFADGTYKLLRQTFILALCVVYTLSLFKRKSGYEFFRTTSNHVKRLLVW